MPNSDIDKIFLCKEKVNLDFKYIVYLLRDPQNKFENIFQSKNDFPEKMSLVSRILRLKSVKTLSQKSFSNVATSRATSGFKMSQLMASAGPKRLFQTSSKMLASDNREEVKVTFIRTSGERLEAKGKVGDNLVIKFIHSSSFNSFGGNII